MADASVQKKIDNLESVLADVAFYHRGDRQYPQRIKLLLAWQLVLDALNEYEENTPISMTTDQYYHRLHNPDAPK